MESMDDEPDKPDNSSSSSKASVAENISDDQELFLKVLENLKNAVNLKPDKYSVALPKQQGNSAECLTDKTSRSVKVDKDLKAYDVIISSEESLPRSDNDKQGATNITVSDKTKSLILQKITVSSELDKFKMENSGVHANESVSETKESLNSIKKGAKQTIHQNASENINVHGNVNIVELNQCTKTDSDKESSVSKIAGFITKVQDTPNLNQSRTARILAPNTNTAKQLYTCNLCDYYSENKNYLKQHIDLVHNNDRPYKCPYCEYAGKRSHALREHLIVHSNERPFQCKSCNATFRKKGHLTNHVKLHNSKRLVKCPLCKMLVYDTGDNGLDAHLKNEHDTERLYGCDLCDHIAANEPEILNHLRTKHKSKLVAYNCDRCPFVTSNTADFNAHMDAHTMANATVQIGNNKPGNVVAVAALPKDLTGQDAPNMSLKIGKDNDVPPQSAVIKPVWIKCSECGFTAQDSEIIKKHMLEHLGMDITVGDPKDHVQQILSPLKNNLKESSQQGISALGQRKSIPVPVTLVENQFQPTSAKLDMHSPVLVPVSDPALLKSLQALPLSSLYSTASPKLVQINPPLVTTTQQPNCPGIISHTSNHNLSTNSQQQIDNVVALASPKASVNMSSRQVLSNQHVLPLQKQQMLKNNTYIKVVPVTNHQSPPNMTFTNPGVNIVSSKCLTTDRSNEGIQTSATHPTQSQQKNVNMSQTSQFQLSQIPVPRNFAPIQAPKLPPEILTMGYSVEEVDKKHNNILKECVHPDDQKTTLLQESLANIQQLVEEQNKLNKKMGHPVVKLNSDGLPEQTSKQKIVYYLSPVEKQNTIVADKTGFTHDSNAGRFKCTLCGYTCEFQRTIKAHVWKHSGNKSIDYPMFQNGPLSIYDDSKTEYEGTKETSPETRNVKETIIASDDPQPIVSMVKPDPITSQISGNKLPSFIVYDQTKISNVAPALANLLAARTMANMSKTKKSQEEDIESDTVMSQENQEPVEKIYQEQNASTEVGKRETKISHLNKELKDFTKSISVSIDYDKLSAIQQYGGYNFDILSGGSTESEGKQKSKPNVVVEAVHTVNCGYTGLQSQQNSPRITPAPKSPDSGVSEMTIHSKTADDKSTSDLTASIMKFESSVEKEGVQTRLNKRRLSERGRDEDYEQITEIPNKKSKSHSLEDSAVTLLSLLKKGPNYNPACPPKQCPVLPSESERNVLSPCQEDSNSTGETEKPKSGISTSLLAVIEQLRERSKSDQDEEKTLVPLVPKKASKRRSRRSSREENESAAGIENVEQFDVDGQIKFRCKLCHYTNESTLLLKQHMRLHKPKQEFECSLCDLIAESSEALQDHMIQHCKVRTYQCKLCNSAFNYKSQLRAHMRMHNDQDILLCDFCDFETRSASALKTHTKSHLTKPPYKCDICKEEFITSFNLRIHKREGCYTSIDRLGHFKCDKCDFTSLGRREMKNHQRVHLLKGLAQDPKVSYCDYTGLTLDQIQQHITDSQGELKTLKCDLCGFVAVSIRSLKSHMKRHVNDQRFVAQPLEQYKCNLCGYVCHHLPSLKSHMWRHAADLHYSYEFTNDVINAAIDFDSRIDAADTTQDHVTNFKKLIFDKMKSKGLESTRNTQEESAAVCCWVTFRCCQCGFETINKAELNIHMTTHSDVIKWTLDVSEEERKQDEVPMVVQEQIVPFVEANKSVPQIMNA